MTLWHALVVEGPLQETRGFATGFVAGRGGRTDVLFGRDIDLEQTHESLGGRLRALFTGNAHEVVLVPDDIAAELATALRTRGAESGLRLLAEYVVTAASVGFQVEVFSHSLARAIRQDLLDGVVPGVRIEDRVEAEEKHPDAKAADRYAPMHHYVFRASGRFVGELPAVLEMRRRARGHDFVEVERVRLEEKA